MDCFWGHEQVGRRSQALLSHFVYTPPPGSNFRACKRLAGIIERSLLNQRWNIDATAPFRQSHSATEDQTMKRKLPNCLKTMLLVALVFPALLAAQRAPRYRLVDLGTFGGPASYLPNGFDGILNNHGTLAGFANTSVPDPFCFVPNCVATHAFRVKNGKIRDLGTLPGGDVSQAVWTSETGLIAGMSQNGESDPLVPGFAEVRAVLWRNGKIIDLGTLPQGGFESLAGAVNNRGQVVGAAITTVPDPCSIFVGFPQTRAFLWQDGAMEDLGTLGGPDALAELINDRGQVAGASYTSSINPSTGCPELHPFLWQNGSMVDLGTLGGTFADVRGMNQRGQVVGFSNLAGDLISHPFLWTRRHLIDLGTLGGDTGLTNWINDRGEIVGKADLPGPAPQLHDAVLWRNGKMIDLGVLPGDACSNAYFVNSHGQVVGASENQELCSILVGQHAFLWEQGAPMVDLNTLIPPGASLDLTYAVAINDRGEIAGFGVPRGCAPEDYELCGHAYMLIPCGHDDECTNVTLDTSSIASAVSSDSSRRAGDPSGRPIGLSKGWQNRLHHGTPSPAGRRLSP
jgi:probable HAF family extracellular repeat protein